MLLQISEPGTKPRQQERKRAVGIDLGTTNSLVATSSGVSFSSSDSASKPGKVETIPDSKGRHLMPSVVHYGANATDYVVGFDAKRELISDPHNTIVSVKRMLGRSHDEVQNNPQFRNYQFDDTPSSKIPALKTAAGIKNPIMVSADILRALAVRAEQALEGKLDGAVITVPAYFNDSQRQQTRDAARLADLPILRLINEPTAAAIAYGLDSQEQGKVVVFDLGGGTFDVSILSMQKGIFEVLATGGDTALGGDDFDRVVMDWIIEEANLGTDLSVGEYNRIVQIAIQAKHNLSDQEQVNVAYREWSCVLSRDTFNKLSSDLVAKTLMACRRVLRDAGLQIDDIDNIILVGGATRMPVIWQQVSAFFNRSPLKDIDPDRVVAIGAAIQADVLVGNKSEYDFLLLDVTPLSLGIETMGELVEKIISRNTTIPVAKAQEFTTFKDGQTAMSIHVLQGERELVSDCRSLARFELKGIPPMVAGAAKIRVTFQVDADGLLSVSAMELSTGKSTQVQVKPSYGLTAHDIEDIMKSSTRYAKEDMQIRALRETQIEAQQMVQSLTAAMKIDGQLLSEPETQKFIALMKQLDDARSGENSEKIRRLTEALNDVTQEFATRRMDAHLSVALRGESIDDIEQ